MRVLRTECCCMAGHSTRFQEMLRATSLHFAHKGLLGKFLVSKVLAFMTKKHLRTPHSQA